MHLPATQARPQGQTSFRSAVLGLLTSSSQLLLCLSASGLLWSPLMRLPIGSRDGDGDCDGDQVSSCRWLVLACSSCDCHDLCFASLVPLTHSGYRVLCPTRHCKQRYGKTCLLIELFSSLGLLSVCLFCD